LDQSCKNEISGSRDTPKYSPLIEIYLKKKSEI